MGVARLRPLLGLAAGLLSVHVTRAAAEAEPPQGGQAGGPPDLTELSLEQLATTRVTSVSRRPEAWAKTPAAIFVITQEDIRRSGARTVPELLRYVPGVDVARVSSSQWAVGIRGFTSTLARAQLVLIDGRSVYSPLFAGTYWDVQNLPLKDVERIEVIRGPGGTLWGANAVNGIVNIITKSAKDTLGGRVTAGAGDKERGFGAASYGGGLGSAGAYRVYARYFDRAPEFDDADGGYDGWHMAQAGFRSDWDLPQGGLTVQGDVYGGREGQRSTIAIYEPPFSRTVEQDAKLGGGDLRARWTRASASGSELVLQAYYDGTRREEPNFREDRDTFDLDGQYRFDLGGRNQMVAGAGYRLSNGRTGGEPAVRFEPPNRTDDIFTAFAEDTLRVVPDRLSVTFGAKLEKNDYTGFEFQPGVRLGLELGEKHFVWLSAGRAVRTPSRIERDLSLDASVGPAAPVFVRLVGNDDFKTEQLFALEAGYRARIGERLLLSVATFRNRFDDVTSLEPGDAFAEPGRVILPFAWANGLRGTVSGVEVSAHVRPSENWSLRAGYSYVDMDFGPKPGSTDTLSDAAEGTNPKHMLFLWSSHNLPRGLLLDAWYRWVDQRPAQSVEAYSELDMRLGWRGRHLELGGVGRNLLHPRHLEFGGGAEVERTFFLEATWRW